MIKENYFHIAIFLIRVTVGAIFLAHGSQKLFGTFGGPGLAGTTEMLQNLGFSAPYFWALLLAVTETLAGLLLIPGIIPRTSAFMIAIVMIIAVIKVHWGKGLFASQGGYEYQLMIIINCIVIILTGGGKYSIFNKF